MNLNWMLSILVHKSLLTIDEAKHLSERLVTTTHPQNFTDAHRVMDKILSELESK
jgi:hypothetical protein